MIAEYIGGGLFAICLILLMMVVLAKGIHTVNRISGWIFVPVVAIGLSIYLWAFLPENPGGPSAILNATLRAVYATCGMFLGKQEYSSVFTKENFNETIFQQILFWTAHLGALFVTASAVLSTFGKKLLMTFRFWVQTLRVGTIHLIFGLHEQSLMLGQDLAKRKDSQVVYVDPNASSLMIDHALTRNATVRQVPYMDGENVNERLLKALGIRRGFQKQLRVILLNPSEDANIRSANALIRYMHAQNIGVDRVQIDLRCNQEFDYSQMRQFEEESGNRYDVNAFSEMELSARLLVHQSAPYRVMEFDETGNAKHNFHALILGFSDAGQYTLRQVVMNGQFTGSTFRADVVDHNLDAKTGRFMRHYCSMMETYDIRLHQMDVRSKEFYELLDSIVHALRYIVICMNSDEMNYALTADLDRYFSRLPEEKRPMILVNVCNRRYVATMKKNIRFFDRQRQIYSGAVFLQEMRDSMARSVNLSYQEKAYDIHEMQEAWVKADYFSRESSRASADFIPAMLKIAGITEAEALEEGLFEERVPYKSTLMESMSITEHLRWEAFHYAMGYSPMPMDVFEKRCIAGIASPQRDRDCLQHACITPWKELNQLGKTQARLTFKPDPEYQEMDRTNIAKIPRTLSNARKIDAYLKKKE